MLCRPTPLSPFHMMHVSCSVKGLEKDGIKRCPHCHATDGIFEVQVITHHPIRLRLLDIHIPPQFTLITFKLQNHLKTLDLIFTYLNQPEISTITSLLLTAYNRKDLPNLTILSKKERKENLSLLKKLKCES